MGHDSGFDPVVLGRSIVYPVDAVLAGREGSVLMRVLVLADGSVSRIEWRDGDDTVLASSAFRALVDFRFPVPGRDSERGEKWVYIPIRFALEPGGPQTDTAGRPIIHVTPRIRTRSGAPALSPRAIQEGRGRKKGKDTLLPTVSRNALRKNLYYPDMARFNRLEGKVVVHALVDSKGKVSSAYVALSDNTIFDAPAMNAVTKASFSPGTVNGKPAALWTLVPVEFLLNAR
jgi:TonB family protein